MVRVHANLTGVLQPLDAGVMGPLNAMTKSVNARRGIRAKANPSTAGKAPRRAADGFNKDEVAKMEGVFYALNRLTE